MQIHKTYNIPLSSGKKTNKVPVTLEQGDVIAGFINVDDASKLGAGFTNLSITSASGKDLVDPVDYRAWKQRSGGTYLDSAKPFYITDKQVYINIYADNNAQADVNFQLVVIHDCVR